MWNFGGISEFFSLLFGIIVVLFLVALFFIFKSREAKELESKTILVPEIRLHTDGKKLDTTYVYKLK